MLTNDVMLDGSLATNLFGPIWNADSHEQLVGAQPGGSVTNLQHGSSRTTAPEEHVQTLAAAGPFSLLGPSGPVFWLVAFVAVFLVLNANVRK